MIREGSGEPLLLLHGVTSNERVWRHVVPLLAPRHDVIAPGALGHRGGREARSRPVRIEQIVDDTERTLDELGIERAHIGGNSLGGWVALELARRGRALTVCCLSPAGLWQEGSEDHELRIERLASSRRDAIRARRLMPFLFRFARVRRYALSLNAVHGERVSREDLIDGADGVIACQVLDDVLATDETVPLLDPAPCPITIAWSGEDRIFPPQRFEPLGRALVPQATVKVLPGVGHVPMFDDPGLTAQTILETTSASQT
ncbi:MAG: alpha/beta fold hydrolase [Solirubrobacterales bacterium]